MSDEFPGYEWLGPVGPNLPDEEGGDFYQTQTWLHRPCGAVVADREAHHRWHTELSQHVLRSIREAQRRRGASSSEQIQ